MPNAALAKKLEGAITDRSRRQSALIDSAITHAGVNPPGRTLEGCADATDCFIDVWNTAAEQIEREFGKGYFPVRLEHALATAFKFANMTPNGWGSWGHHLCLLHYLDAREGPEKPDRSAPGEYCTRNVYQWMSDLLFTTFSVPERMILREASAANGRYRRVLRKRTVAKAMTDAAEAIVLNYELADDQHREKRHAHAIWLGAANEWLVSSGRNADLVLPSMILGQMQTNWPTQLCEALAPPDQENQLAREAKDDAEPLRAVFAELSDLSGRNAAAELNRRGIKTPGGGKWHQAQVERVRKRLGRP